MSAWSSRGNVIIRKGRPKAADIAVIYRVFQKYMENAPQYIRLVPSYLSPAGDGDKCLIIEDIICGGKYYGDFKLSESFVSYILEKAICSRCLEVIIEATHLNACDKPAKSDSSWSSLRNRRCYVESANESEFKELWEKEKR